MKRDKIKRDNHGFEIPKSIVKDGMVITLGDKVRCSCIFEVVELRPVWDVKTKNVIPDHPQTRFLYRCISTHGCLFHTLNKKYSG